MAEQHAQEMLSMLNRIDETISGEAFLDLCNVATANGFTYRGDVFGPDLKELLAKVGASSDQAEG